MSRQGGNGHGPTITDIARQVGVSHTAVSMALRGAPGVSDKRRREIMQVARQMNYQPQIAAKLLRSKHTGQLGLIAPSTTAMDSSSGFFLPMVVAFVSVCETEGVGYHIEFFNDGGGGGDSGPRQLTGGLVDGTLAVGYIDAGLRAWLAGQDRFPWVSIDEPGPVCVLSAADLGTESAVRHLAALGHRRLAFACGPLKYTTHRLSREGFLRAAADLAPAADGWVRDFDLEPPADTLAVGMAWAAELLAGEPRPTAVFCNDLRLARAVVHVAEQRGLRVPEDLSVIGAGTADHATLAPPPLATVEPDFHAMVRRGVQLLQQWLRDGRPPEGNERITPHLLPGASIAAPADHAK